MTGVSKAVSKAVTKVDGRFSSGVRLGILGGGQLAKMLCEAAYPLGLVPVVYTADPQDSAARISPRVFNGTLTDEVRLDRFLEIVDTVVFENEFVDGPLLERLGQRHPAVRFQPSLAALTALKDKADQKAVLQRLAIPTAPFALLPDAVPVATWIGEMARQFPDGFVLKLGTMGYDGKGVFFFRDRSDVVAAVAFAEGARARKSRCYAEKLVPFRRELALVACRGIDGSFAAYPLVVSEQENGICVRVVGPATSLGVEPRRQAEAERFARQIAESVSLVGTFAIELFELGDGSLAVNELAPRVHNSGHYTQDACVTSQYENHWRAVLGLPLGATDSVPAFAMENLLGPGGVTSGSESPDLPVAPPGGHLHWYGKEIRPRRKVGHLNGTAASIGELPALRASLIQCREEWEKRLGQS